MTWYSTDLGDGTQAFAPTNAILESFIPIFAAAGAPIDMAVFSRYDLGRNVVTVYFSPGAATMAQMYGATPCEKPGRDTPDESRHGRLGLLAGDQRCWELFFPAAQ